MTRTGSMVIEFNYEEEDTLTTNIEKEAYHWLSLKIPDLQITHLEVAAQGLKEAFGVGLEK